MKTLLCSALLALSLCRVQAQDTTYARSVINKLTSEQLFGRGYVNNGVQKAAAFLEGEMKANGLTPLRGGGYRQSFNLPVNTFPGKMEVRLDGRLLTPGVHYIVAAESKGVSGTFKMSQKDSTTYIGFGKKKEVFAIVLKRKLTGNIAPEAAEYTAIELLRDSFPGFIHKVEVNIENHEEPAYRTANMMCYVKGTVQPDSFLVFTAHYDHLGGMGNEMYFPGANDNASGVSLVLDLAKYYAKHPMKYSVAFIFFSGEEAGLVGSKFYTEHPVFPLEKIRFLVNLDLLGTGDEGITVVNATEYKAAFDRMTAINTDKKLLPQVKARGKAQNSDHYWFSEKGVPCFFIYTMGGIKAYHDVYDISRTLPLTRYREVFQLLTRFAEGF